MSRAASGKRPSLPEFSRGVRAIAARELGAYFDSSIAYVYTIAFAVLANSVFMNEFFLAGTADMRGWFERMPLFFAVFLPAVSMRLWAEERRQRTIEPLLTLPIVPLQAVLGKYAAALALLGVFLASSLPIVVMLVALGRPDLGQIASSYLGLIGLGALLLAAGALLSALSGDQIVAFVTASLAAFALVLSGEPRVVAVLDGLAPALAAGTLLRDTLSAMPHFESFLAGSVSLAAVLYFLLFSVLFLWTNALLLARART
jgi:ABC-2 type transport system permease protein